MVHYFRRDVTPSGDATTPTQGPEWANEQGRQIQRWVAEYVLPTVLFPCQNLTRLIDRARSRSFVSHSAVPSCCSYCLCSSCASSFSFAVKGDHPQSAGSSYLPTLTMNRDSNSTALVLPTVSLASLLVFHQHRSTTSSGSTAYMIQLLYEPSLRSNQGATRSKLVQAQRQ